MNYEKITIIGCGTVGSYLAYQIALRNIELKKVKELTLIDYDSLIDKDLPYIIGNMDKFFVGSPKTMALQHILNGVNPNLVTIGINKKYSDGLLLDLDNNFIIDCRDTQDCNKYFKLKLNLDGPYGMINIKPDNKINKKESRYTFSNNKYYANLFTIMVTQLLFNNKKQDKNIYIVDMRDVIPQIIEYEKNTNGKTDYESNDSTYRL